MTQIKWTNTTIKLGDLVPWEHNPRYSTEVQAERITDSHRVFGQAETLAIDSENNVLNGHQRLNAWLAEYGPDFEIDARKADKIFDEAEKQAFTAMLHAAAVGSWDFAEIANWGWDADELASFGFDDVLIKEWHDNAFSLEELRGSNNGTNKKKITESGRLYNAGDGHNIEPFKLAYRIEAIWRSRRNLAIDVYSGEGQLSAWYNRCFDRVVTNDKNYAIGEVDFCEDADEFISNHILEFIDFDFIDFDDEGTPADSIITLFKCISGKKSNSFYLALTDGNAMNFKFNGKFDFSRYMMDYGVRKTTREDYDNADIYVTEFVKKCAIRAGFTPTMLSSYRGREGNVVFQTWFIDV